MVACADVHLGNARSSPRQFGGKCKVYQDYRKLLDRKDIDAVTIGTPDHWHVKIAIDAMKAGKHVYCEKPLTLTLEEGELICAAVKKYRKIFQVGTQQRSEYELRFLKAVAIARSGRLGKNLHAISSVGKAGSRQPNKNKRFGPFPTQAPPAELNWDMWLGQAPEVPFCPERIGWDFRWWFEYSGGQVTDWGVHHTDIAFWALAGKDGQVVEAEPKSCKFMSSPREKVLRFPAGQGPGQGHARGLQRGPRVRRRSEALDRQHDQAHQRPERIADRGRKRQDPRQSRPADRQAGRGDRRRPQGQAGNRGADGRDLRRQPAGRQVGPHAELLRLHQSGKQPVANVFDHVRAVNACHLANIAMLVGRKIQWDPAAEQFVGDDEANALRSRKEREPYVITV